MGFEHRPCLTPKFMFNTQPSGYPTEAASPSLPLPETGASPDGDI